MCCHRGCSKSFETEKCILHRVRQEHERTCRHVHAGRFDDTHGWYDAIGITSWVFQKRKGEDKSMVQLLHSGDDFMDERHRHRYEVNPEYVERLEKVGYRFIGKDETGKRMEVFGRDTRNIHTLWDVNIIPNSSLVRPLRHPTFGLILAASGQLDEYLKLLLLWNETRVLE